MKEIRTIVRDIAAAGVLGIILTLGSSACGNRTGDEKVADPKPAPEEGEAKGPGAGDKRTVRGVLRHFPQNVKSAQAWLGHEFTVDGTPIRPTEAVTAEALRKLVGKTVTVEGKWNAGKEWNPTGEEQLLPTPEFPGGKAVIRGSGIEAASVVEG